MGIPLFHHHQIREVDLVVEVVHQYQLLLRLVDIPS